MVCAVHERVCHHFGVPHVQGACHAKVWRQDIVVQRLDHDFRPVAPLRVEGRGSGRKTQGAGFGVQGLGCRV